MIKVGLIGLGSIGHVHLDAYAQLEREGFPIKLVAIFDTDEQKLKGNKQDSNVVDSNGTYDLSKVSTFTDADLFFQEDMDMVDITLPTYLHDEFTIRSLNKGLHVLCEKPIALNSDNGAAMLEAAAATGKKLMIAHCLRFWPEYEYLKSVVDSATYGQVKAATFFRGGGAPTWSYENWMLQVDKSGGALVDLHIHDVDMINFLFGKPESVSALCSDHYDIVSAHFRYSDGKIIHADADLSLPGEFGFAMTYRVHMETATLVFEAGRLTVYPANEPAWVYEHDGNLGYYREIKYFAERLLNDEDIITSTPEDSLLALRIVEAERKSASSSGQFIQID
ncbi:Gfo/Idh/MocA family protein [Paenibacillus sp. PAMC21692]|uniref:Gfo/Idh/MocA family protein n=1 Tax=Paenibacillus sp. PAMC21692 TaxID=2762320 RepID=UPI00164E77D2|nr:Gfo/Idh/MocA family oxidoreductase [Paenibacillus sp. PAMC21692]QNK59509.1 Gfo/Idh/MocA family oxidoreductase [Paenibacillus sp. PAMC21692]